jgi:glycopeptide antibiotics resistance protein
VDYGRSSHDLTRWHTYVRVEFLASVAMFLPIGVNVISGVLLTLTIEFAQRFIPGCVSDLRDLVANSLGTVLGVLVALVLTQATFRRLRSQQA